MENAAAFRIHRHHLLQVLTIPLMIFLIHPSTTIQIFTITSHFRSRISDLVLEAHDQERKASRASQANQVNPANQANRANRASLVKKGRALQRVQGLLGVRKVDTVIEEAQAATVIEEAQATRVLQVHRQAATTDQGGLGITTIIIITIMVIPIIGGIIKPIMPTETTKTLVASSPQMIAQIWLDRQQRIIWEISGSQCLQKSIVSTTMITSQQIHRHSTGWGAWGQLIAQ